MFGYPKFSAYFRGKKGVFSAPEHPSESRVFFV